MKYKVVFIDYHKGGYEIQMGKTEALEKLIQLYADKGYELVCITPCCYPVDASNQNFILTFKTNK